MSTNCGHCYCLEEDELGPAVPTEWCPVHGDMPRVAIRKILDNAALEDEVREFPMLDGPPITWAIARKVYERYTSNQSLESIAARGGFGWAEVALMFKRPLRRGVF